MDLDGLALHQDRLKRLNPETVQGRRPVEEHRMLLDDFGEHVPHLGPGPLHHPLGRLDVLSEVLVDEPLHDEGLEQLEGHLLGQAALMQLELGADHDDGPSRVVDSLAEQVLTEPALLALQHVGQRLERAVARSRHRPAAPAVVEEGIDCLLQHALLVVDDDLGSTEIEQSLETVVAVDDPAIQVVQVAGGEPAAVELHHRAQVGRDDRERLPAPSNRGRCWPSANGVTTLSRLVARWRRCADLASRSSRS